MADVLRSRRDEVAVFVSAAPPPHPVVDRHIHLRFTLSSTLQGRSVTALSSALFIGALCKALTHSNLRDSTLAGLAVGAIQLVALEVLTKCFSPERRLPV